MKKVAIILVGLMAYATAPLAGAGERILLVEVVDHDEKVSYELMSPDSYKQISEELQQEKRYHSKALMAAEKEWKASEDTARKTFPRSALKDRKAKLKGTYTDQESADKKLAYYEEKLFDKMKRDEERQKDRDKLLGKDKDKVAQDRAKEQEKEMVKDRARELYLSKLKELMTPATEAKDAKK